MEREILRSLSRLVKSAFVIQDLASEVLINMQVDTGQATLGHVHPKDYKFFYESSLVLLEFREIFHCSS